MIYKNINIESVKNLNIIDTNDLSNFMNNFEGIRYKETNKDVCENNLANWKYVFFITFESGEFDFVAICNDTHFIYKTHCQKLTSGSWNFFEKYEFSD